MRTIPALACLSVGCLAAGLIVAAAPPRRSVTDADRLFDPAKVWEATLSVAADDWAKMPAKRRGPGRQPAPRPGGDGVAGGFNLDFTYVPGNLTFAGRNYDNVAVRFKGNSSYTSAPRGAKRSFKIDFKRYVPGQDFHGLTKINLTNNAFDPSQLRETVAYRIYRGAGVPASRTTFVELSLTVPGKYDKVYLGLYTLIEEVDKTFLRDRFGSAKGLLLKPERMRGLEYLGEKWIAYEEKYVPRTKARAADRKRLLRLAWLIDRANDRTFADEIGSLLDIDAFVRFLAASALVGNPDSFLGLGHNYYLYLDPTQDRFTFLPWDLNLAFAGMPFGGNSAQQMALSIDHPHIGDNALIDRLLALPKVRQAYRERVRHLVAEQFNPRELGPFVRRLEGQVKAPIAREKKALTLEKSNAFGAIAMAMLLNQPSLATFVEKRSASALAQLDGKENGHVPERPNLFGFKPPRRGAALAKALVVKADTDADKKLSKAEAIAGVESLFATRDATKPVLLTQSDLARLIVPLVPRAVGTAFAESLFNRAKVAPGGSLNVATAKELLETLFDEADRNGDGKLDESEVIAYIDRLTNARRP